MFKELGQIASLMKQAQGLSSRMQEAQERLASRRCIGEAGGGMVAVELTGQGRAVRCQIDPVLLQSGDREMLEELVVAAINQAQDKVREAALEEMGQLTGGLNLPGLGDALSGLGFGA